MLFGTGTEKILVLDISGLISDSSGSTFFERRSLPSRVKEELTKASDDHHVKAVVLRINSPGGTVTASDIIHHEITQFKEKRQVPVIACIMDVGTSGAYYVAMGSDYVVAHPSSITGSLGVIMVTLNAAGLLEKVGIEANTVTSGDKKDMGSPFRSMTEEERQIFQGIIDFFHGRFVQVIDEGRGNLTQAEVRQMADGRIYSTEQAKQLGLIDDIGYLDDAIELAKQRAGLRKARVIMYQQPGKFNQNIYSEPMMGDETDIPSFPRVHAEVLATLFGGGTSKFMYLWLP